MIISEEPEHTGKFFGQIDGTIMDSLVQDRIYKRVTVNDYQGICSNADNPYAATGDIIKPYRDVSWLYNYVVHVSAAWLGMLPLPLRAWPQDDYTYNEDFEEPTYPDDYEPFEEDYNSPVDDELEEFFTTTDVVSLLLNLTIFVLFLILILYCSFRNIQHHHQSNINRMSVLE